MKCRGKHGDIMTWEETLSRRLSPRELSFKEEGQAEEDVLTKDTGQRAERK